MTFRPVEYRDILKLRAIHAEQGFDYPFPDLTSKLMETCLVAVDDQNEPIAAVLAERLVQLYFIGQKQSPAEGLFLLRKFHEALEPVLQAKGYSSAEAFLPPPIEKPFGRRLMKSFGWVKNWQSYCFHFKGVR